MRTLESGSIKFNYTQALMANKQLLNYNGNRAALNRGVNKRDKVSNGEWKIEGNGCEFLKQKEN